MCVPRLFVGEALHHDEAEDGGVLGREHLVKARRFLVRLANAGTLLAYLDHGRSASPRSPRPTTSLRAG